VKAGGGDVSGGANGPNGLPLRNPLPLSDEIFTIVGINRGKTVGMSQDNRIAKRAIHIAVDNLSGLNRLDRESLACADARQIPLA